MQMICLRNECLPVPFASSAWKKAVEANCKLFVIAKRLPFLVEGGRDGEGKKLGQRERAVKKPLMQSGERKTEEYDAMTRIRSGTTRAAHRAGGGGVSLPLYKHLTTASQQRTQAKTQGKG